jgi:hypothetical protein
MFDWVELVEINKDHGIVQNPPSLMDVVVVVAAVAVVVVVVVVDKQMEDTHLAWVAGVDNGMFVAAL